MPTGSLCGQATICALGLHGPPLSKTQPLFLTWCGESGPLLDHHTTSLLASWPSSLLGRWAASAAIFPRPLGRPQDHFSRPGPTASSYTFKFGQHLRVVHARLSTKSEQNPTSYRRFTAFLSFCRRKPLSLPLAKPLRFNLWPRALRICTRVFPPSFSRSKCSDQLL